GAALATVGMGGIIFGLIRANDVGLAEPLVIVAIAIGVIALVAFAIEERQSRAPMMPPSLFRTRSFVGANALTLFLYAALGGALLATTVMASVSRGETGIASGINNAVARTAALFAIAGLGLVATLSFQRNFTARLEAAGLDSRARASIESQPVRWGEAPVPH